MASQNMLERIPFDSLALKCVADELHAAVLGGMVQRIDQPGEFDLAITIRNRGSNHRLVLSCHPRFARVHLSAIKLPNPPTPPAFCMACRKHLEGGRIRRIAQREFDRILDIEVERAESMATLVAELMGKHSNLIVISENHKILDACKRIGSKLSRYRQVLPGRPYIAPPGQPDKLDPFQLNLHLPNDTITQLPNDPEALSARLMAHFSGMSPFLAMELAERSIRGSLEESWDEILGAASRGEWAPVLIRNSRGDSIGAYPFPTIRVPADWQHSRESFNIALDHYYSAAISRADLDSAREMLAADIERAIRAREHKLASLERSLEESHRAEDYRITGELLLANLERIEPGAESVVVIDDYSPETSERAIPLQPQLSARENADAYFRRYRKARDSARIHREQVEAMASSLVELQEANSRLSESANGSEIAELRRDLMERELLRKDSKDEKASRKATSFGGKKIRAITTPEGWEILVGENSEANDYLTGKIAAPNDIWLHVRAGASAHVVIRTQNKPDAVPAAVIKLAAQLAAQHSPSKHASIVPVDYTLKKFVRRPRGAPSGTVLIRNEKTLHVNPRQRG